MNWRLPFVSRRAYDLILEQFERVLLERNQQQERADRAMDQLATRYGYEPVSAPVRQEVAAARASVDAHLAQTEDPGMGMIDEEYIDSVQAALAPTSSEVV